MTYRSSKSVHWCDVARDKETKKKDKETLQWQTEYCICPDHPRRRIEIKFCTGVVFWVVLTFKFH